MPDIPKLLYDGYQHQLRGQLEEAARIYRKILRAEPGNADVLILLGIVRDRQFRHAGSDRDYDKAIRFKPDSPQAHYNRGVAFTKLGRYPEAAPSFARAIELRPELPEALGEYARASRVICDWSRHDWIERQLIEMVRNDRTTLNPQTLLQFSDDPADLLACARGFVAHFLGPEPSAAAPAAPGPPGRRENPARLSLRRFPRARGRLSHRAVDRAPRPRPLRGHRHFHRP